MTDLMNSDAKAALQMLAKVLDGVFNKDISDNKFGFCLLVFEKEGEAGSRTNYISNCDRKDMIAALKEVTGRFEGQAQQTGRA